MIAWTLSIEHHYLSTSIYGSISKVMLVLQIHVKMVVHVSLMSQLDHFDVIVLRDIPDVHVISVSVICVCMNECMKICMGMIS